MKAPGRQRSVLTGQTPHLSSALSVKAASDFFATHKCPNQILLLGSPESFHPVQTSQATREQNHKWEGRRVQSPMQDFTELGTLFLPSPHVFAKHRSSYLSAAVIKQD